MDEDEEPMTVDDILFEAGSAIVEGTLGDTVYVNCAILIVEVIDQETGTYKLVPYTTDVPSWRATGMLDAVADGIRSEESAVETAYATRSLLMNSGDDDAWESEE